MIRHHIEAGAGGYKQIDYTVQLGIVKTILQTDMPLHMYKPGHMREYRFSYNKALQLALCHLGDGAFVRRGNEIMEFDEDVAEDTGHVLTCTSMRRLMALLLSWHSRKQLARKQRVKMSELEVEWRDLLFV